MPPRLHFSVRLRKVELPNAVVKDPNSHFFRTHPPQEWLPEHYLEAGESDLQPFFDVLSVLMVSRDPFNTQFRSFCHHLWTYFHKDEAGMLHKKLLESEVQSKLKGKIYNMGFVGDAYSDANEGTLYMSLLVPLSCHKCTNACLLLYSS